MAGDGSVRSMHRQGCHMPMAPFVLFASASEYRKSLYGQVCRCAGCGVDALDS